MLSFVLEFLFRFPKCFTNTDSLLHLLIDISVFYKALIYVDRWEHFILVLMTIVFFNYF